MCYSSLLVIKRLCSYIVYTFLTRTIASILRLLDNNSRHCEGVLILLEAVLVPLGFQQMFFCASDFLSLSLSLSLLYVYVYMSKVGVSRRGTGGDDYTVVRTYVALSLPFFSLAPAR